MSKKAKEKRKANLDLGEGHVHRPKRPLPHLATECLSHDAALAKEHAKHLRAPFQASVLKVRRDKKLM